MLARKYIIGLTAVFFATAAWIGVGIYDQRSYRAGLASDLNISSLPESTRVTHCESPLDNFTDVVYKCTLEFPKSDLPVLLAGYKYKHYGNTYEAWPKEFEYGGQVLVETDPSGTKATIDVYIE